MRSLSFCDHLDDVVELLASVVEVLADVGGDLFAGVLHGEREDILNHGLAPTASRTSLSFKQNKNMENEKRQVWKMRNV